MGKSNKVENATVNEVKEVKAEETAVETKEKLGSKLIGGVKKHGKKLAVGAGVVVGGLIAYGLGLKKGKESAGDDGDSGVRYYDDNYEDEAYVTEE